MSPTTIKTALMLVELGIRAASGVPEALSAYDRLKAMKEEGRDPTPEEFADLAVITGTLHDDIQRG